MSSFPVPRIADCFCDLDDPRIERTKRHQLLDLVTIALCAVLAGAESWVEVEEWGEIKLPWLRTWLGLPNGIPSHDTFGRVFSRLDPGQLEQGLVRWARLLATDAPDGAAGHPGVVAIDGKTIRAARHPGQRAPHLVSAWSSASRLVLGQVAVDDKSNEITAIPVVLRQLELRGQVVTIDAMGCQTAIAAQIVAQGGDYVLALKENQPDLLRDVIDSFALADPGEPTITKEKGHGRIETRTCCTITDAAVLAWLDPQSAWPGLRSIAKVVGRRQIGEVSVEHTRYYLSSLPGDAQQIAEAVRSHWGIENQVHWVLDVAFREDVSRARVGHAAANLALVRKLVLNLLRADPSRKVGVKASRLKAGWDDGYLLTILGVQLEQ